VLLGTGCAPASQNECARSDRVATKSIGTLYARKAIPDGYEQYRFYTDSTLDSIEKVYPSQTALEQLRFLTQEEETEGGPQSEFGTVVYRIEGWVFDADPCSVYEDEFKILDAVRDLTIETLPSE
jgi:hypothetical protein